MTQLRNSHPQLPVWQWLTVLVLPLLLYANVLTGDHGYVLDDAIVITQNQFTQQGFAGINDIFSHETFVGFFGEQKELVAGSRYRPLSVATFAIEVELFGQNPWISHLLNVLFYSLTGGLLLLLLFELMQQRFSKWQFTLPFIATLLFLVHPLHTEVVANIKGRDEIFSLLFSLLALWGSLRWYRHGSAKHLILAGVSFLLALLSKENAYTFVAVIPLTFWVTEQVNRKKIGIITLVLAAIAVVGIIWRVQVVGSIATSNPITELMNNPFVGATAEQQWATILFTWGKYLQLLVWPASLSHDYYPYHISLTTFSDPRVILPGLVYLAGAIVAVVGILKRWWIGWAIAFYAFTFSIVSNALFPIGTFMSERLVYMSSVGFAIAVAWLLVKIPEWRKQLSPHLLSGTWQAFQSYASKQWVSTLLLLIALVGWGWTTIDRNPVWQSNESLFLTDVEHAPGSAKLNNAAGGVLYDCSQQSGRLPQQKQEDLQQSKFYLERAVEIHPAYFDAWKTLGNVYFYLDGDYEEAIAAYKKAGDEAAIQNILAIGQRMQNQGNRQGALYALREYHQLRPMDPNGVVWLSQSLMNGNRPQEALQLLNTTLQQFPTNADLYLKRGLVYGQHLNNLSQAIADFSEVVRLAPDRADGYENLGVAYAVMGEPQQAITYLEKALQINPNNKQTHANLAMAYQSMGNLAKAQEHQRLAQ